MMEVAEVSRTKFDPYVIGNNIRDLRGKRKMTQMKAAEEMDMSLCHYARIEEGSKGMSIQMLFRFINFFCFINNIRNRFSIFIAHTSNMSRRVNQTS